MITLVPIGEVEKGALETVRLALTEAFGQGTRVEERGIKSASFLASSLVVRKAAMLRRGKLMTSKIPLK